MTTFRTRLTEIAGIVVMVLTFGLVRLDRPRVPRVRKMGVLRRLLVALLARFRGHRDGRRGIPNEADTKPTPELIKLKQQGDGVLRRLAASWSEVDSRLNGEYNAILREHDLVEERLVELDKDLKEAKRCHEERYATLEAKRRDEEAREAEERWRIRKRVYAALITLIFLGEFPLNAVAFRLFGEAEVVTWVMTGGLAAVLVFCAHGLGVLLRLKKMSYRDEVLAWLLGVFPIAVIAAVGIVREVYLEDLGGTGSGIGQLGSVGGTIVFALINLLIYLGAFVLSYLHHDPVGAGLERLEKSVKRMAKEVDRVQHTIDLGRRRELWILAKADRWRAGREGWLRESTFQAKRHKDFYEAFMQSYYSANRMSLEKRWDRLRRKDQRAQNRARRRQGNDDVPPLPARPTLPKVLETVTETTRIRMADEFRDDHPLHWDREPPDPGRRAALSGSPAPVPQPPTNGAAAAPAPEAGSSVKDGTGPDLAEEVVTRAAQHGESQEA